VAPAGLVLGFGHGVHLSRLVDTIVAAYVVNLKGGIDRALTLLLLSDARGSSGIGQPRRYSGDAW
jgi:hypothetical protein